jgi:hypothetical protein
MKILNSVILFLAVVNLSFSQVIILQEDFTSYQANTQTTPAGWMFSYQGNYTTSTFSGSSGPNAYKFGGTTTTTINTPPFLPGADSIKFWIKGSGTDSISQLIIFESTDSLSWDTLTKICPIPTMAAKGKRSFPVAALSTHLRFKYIKSAGNLAFDDFRLIKNSPTGMQAPNSTINFSVYPNPAVDGRFTIQLGTTKTEAAITVCNVLGEAVRYILTNEQSEFLDLSGVQRGVYFVNVKQGELFRTRKIVIAN